MPIEWPKNLRNLVSHLGDSHFPLTYNQGYKHLTFKNLPVTKDS